jgi:predicted flap endonuclease-1-like 5' DNA nuclease
VGSTRILFCAAAAGVPRLQRCRNVLIFLIILLVTLAALGGYAYGTLRRAGTASTSDVATPTTRAMESPAAASNEGRDQPRASSATEQAPEDRVGAEKARLIRSRDAEAAMLREQLFDRDAALARLQTVGLDLERLSGELADARAEAARYRQLIVDIENNAPPPILSGSAGPDDLKLIVGVGPVLERMLHNLGITTFRQIARWTEREVAEFDAKLPEFPGRITRDQWVTQARALHEQKYG